MQNSRIRTWTNAALLLLIFAFLLSYFDPKLLFSDTTPTGGDTPSHFATAVLFRDVLLHHFQITSWNYGNLAGYPLFQYYFPLPFILCALLSLVLPITVSFKIVSVLGVFLLTPAAFYFLKRLDLPFPAPILGAGATLPFLFVESQSMWGGNISSTLAGEFTYSLGMAIALVYLAEFYAGIDSKRHLFRNALLLALAGFSHGCALLVAGAMPFFCVFQGSDTFARLKYYAKVNLLAFLLLAFWLIPWLSTQTYMAPFNFFWVFHSWTELFPRILIPLYALALLSASYSIFRMFRGQPPDGRLLYLWFGSLTCAVFFQIGYQLNVVDIRFIPFLQLFLTLISAAFVATIFQKLPASWCFAAAALLVAIVWTDTNSTSTRGWIKWNNEGFENKQFWSILRETTGYLKGTMADSRVVYEHSAQHDQFGSIRTFESLPFFSGRATLEGAYLQSSINSPFIFYLQSEVSEVTSCPLPDYHCATLNLEKALPHLSLFNVGQLILRTDAAKAEARRTPELTLEKTFGPLEIYRIRSAGNRYVVPLSCRPVLYTGNQWKRETFRWYRGYTPASVPVVIDAHPALDDLAQFVRTTGSFPNGETCTPSPDECRVSESIEHDRIGIRTPCLGHPLLIKMTYHPRWRVSGARKIYLATPGFMLVFPTAHDVELSFGWSPANYLGAILSIGAVLLGLGGLRRRRGGSRLVGFAGHPATRGMGVSPMSEEKTTGGTPVPPPIGPFARLETARGSRFLKLAVGGAALSFVAAVMLGVTRNNSNILFEKGLKYYFIDDFDSARGYFQRAAEISPESSSGINGRFYWGVCLYRQKQYAEAASVFRNLAEEFPESMHAPESLYQVGMSLQASDSPDAGKYFRQVLERYPNARWAQFSKERLMEADFLIGMKKFDAQDLETARRYFQKVSDDNAASSDLRAKSSYFAAICNFKRARWETALGQFKRLAADYPGSIWVAEATYHVGLCYRELGRKELADRSFAEVIRRFPETPWAGYARERMGAARYQ